MRRLSESYLQITLPRSSRGAAHGQVHGKDDRSSYLATNMSSSCCTSKRTLSYRLTGLQSIERIDPILKSSDEFDWISINHSADALDFVWETSCKVVQRSQHVEARILNKLHNSIIIEDKSNLAFLQLNLRDSSSSGFLKTYVAENAKEVSRWASNRWTLSTTSMKDRTRILAGELESGSNVKALKSTRSQQQNTLSDDRCNDSDWWVVKASKGNGGRDIWILNKDNAEAVLSDLPTTDGAF